MELALNAFGFDVARARLTPIDTHSAIARLDYLSGLTVTLHLLITGTPWTFSIAACTSGGLMARQIENDKSHYLTGVRRFLRMFQTHEEPLPHEYLLKPILVLEAMMRSWRSGKMESAH